MQRLRLDIIIDNDRTVVYDFVRSYATCQRNKMEALHPADLLQPLDVPSQEWADISLADTFIQRRYNQITDRGYILTL